MKPKVQSMSLLGITRSKAKMWEYAVPEQYHISLKRDPSKLLSLTIGILGDYGKSNSFIEGNEIINDNREELLFSAQYFDSFIESRLNTSLSAYLCLVGSASYYLCDLPGSAGVLVNRIPQPNPNMEGDGLEKLLFWSLKQSPKQSIDFEENSFSDLLKNIYNNLVSFYENGLNDEKISEDLDILCKAVYSSGTSRHLLLADITRSIVKKQLYNSSWNSISRYTGIDINSWKDIIHKSTFIKEFWPAQKLLGEKKVYNGMSAVIQMPTSAGKTKSTEIIIRSSFLSGRANMAVIVAPFRALCSEIKNSLQIAFEGEPINIDAPSDALQKDFESIENFNFKFKKLVLILTPEKFSYMLRNATKLANEIGLLIYDEGHQFDNGIRGVTYELLLSSLKNLVPKSAQIILISAVISNAESIGEWLIDDSREIILGTDLSPTYRTIAFTSWKDLLGRLEFVNPKSPDKTEYFVPRVIEQTSLELIGRERKEKLFPEKEDGKSLALYLAIKLVKNGPVAIFCGSKLIVKNLYEKVVDLKTRNYNLSELTNSYDIQELNKLSYLYSEHFGIESNITKSCMLGVFAHSGNTPQGIRLAIEYAMQKGKIKFIICTSTLAQGVNLPIKYLLITSFYQAQQKITIRDFNNLIGRAGRSGAHTEGSIIFTDSELYDQKDWKWDQAKELLNPLKSEPCSSTLLSIFDPLQSEDKNYFINIEPLKLVNAYLESPEKISDLPKKFSVKYSDKNFTTDGLSFQISYKIQIISAIESFLMAHWESSNLESNDEGINNLAKGTFAYFLSNDDQRDKILELFKLLAQNVKNKISNPAKKTSYSRTLFGVQAILEIESWTLTNINSLLESNSIEKLLPAIWPILTRQARSKKLMKLVPPEASLALAQEWIKGESYVGILNYLDKTKVKIMAKSQSRSLNQETIVEICESAFAYDITLVIAAINEILSFEDNNAYGQLLDLLNELLKRIKYGLPNFLAIALYEIGFADRVIAIDLATRFNDFPITRVKLVKYLKRNEKEVLSVLEKYPEYYTMIFYSIVNE